MAIFIPKKNIYDEDVEKVRDNIIEKIEVNAYNFSAPLKYGEVVFNGIENDFLDDTKGDEVDDIEIYTREYSNSYSPEVACSYLKIIPYFSEIIIQFEQKTVEGYIDSIISDINEIGVVNNCRITKSASNSYTATLTYKTDKTYSISDINRGGAVEANTENTLILDTIDFNHSYTFTSYPTDVQSYGDAVTIEGGIDKEEFIKIAPPISIIGNTLQAGIYELKLKVLSKYERIELGGVTHIKSGVGNVNVSLTGQGTICEIQSAEFTIKGNIFIIDLEEQTISIKDQDNGKPKKVISFDSNEFMQTTNYYTEDNGKTQTPAINKAFTNTLNEYKNGKETLTLRCDINDYYDNNGYKEISINQRNKLPYGFTQYESLYLNGYATKKDAYVDTGVVADENTSIFVKFTTQGAPTSTSGEYGSVFGARQGSSNNELNLSTYTNNGNQPYGLFRYGSKTYNAYISNGREQTVEISNNKYTISNFYDYETFEPVNKEVSLTPVKFNTQKTVTIGALNDAQQGVVQFLRVSIYSFKMYQNGVLIRDFVPCGKENDGYGLYDLVNKKYHKAQGANNICYSSQKVEEFVGNKMLFAVGDKVIPIFQNSKDDKSKKYKFIDYIESTGTQYIDTGVKANNDIKIKAKFQATTYLSSNYIFGARSDSQKDVINLIASNNEQWLIRYGSSSNKSTPKNDYNIHNVIMGYDGVYLDEKFIYTPEGGEFEAKNNIYIFGVNQNGEFKKGYCRIYSFEIFQDNNLVRDFKPCYRIEDGVFGLYDTVREEFYENANKNAYGVSTNFKALFKTYRVNGRKVYYDGAVWQELSLQED